MVSLPAIVLLSEIARPHYVMPISMMHKISMCSINLLGRLKLLKGFHI